MYPTYFGCHKYGPEDNNIDVCLLKPLQNGNNVSLIVTMDTFAGMYTRVLSLYIHVHVCLCKRSITFRAEFSDGI